MKKLFTIILTLIAWCGAASAQFTIGQFVTCPACIATINAVHLTPVIPTVLPYNPAIPIINVQPVVTSGVRPLVIGGPSCTVTMYGLGADGSVYDISSVAWASPPQVVQFSGGTRIGNVTLNPATILQLGFTTQAPTNPGKIVGMSFTEQGPPAYSAWPASTVEVKGNPIVDNNGNIQQVLSITGNAETGTVAPTWANGPPFNTGATTTDNNVTWGLGAPESDPAYNIQVTSVVVLPTTGFSFNDLVSTLQQGLTPPPALPTYDINVAIPANPPYTERQLNVPQAALTASSVPP